MTIFQGNFAFLKAMVTCLPHVYCHGKSERYHHQQMGDICKHVYYDEKQPKTENKMKQSITLLTAKNKGSKEVKNTQLMNSQQH